MVVALVEMNCVTFKLKFKVLLRLLKIMFFFCIVDLTKLESNEASIFGLIIVLALSDYIYIFGKNRLDLLIEGLGYVLKTGESLPK